MSSCGRWLRKWLIRLIFSSRPVSYTHLNHLTKEQIEAFDFVAESGWEDKETICKLLCKVLQKTRGAADLVSLTYDGESEIVIAAFEGGKMCIRDRQRGL